MRSKAFVVSCVVLGVGFLLSAVPLDAHHSFAAQYDADKQVTLKGKIVKMEWTNPHSWLYIEVKDPDGKTATWALEFGAPNALYRRGWRQNSLPVGVEVTVTTFLAKDGSTTGAASNVTLPDGKRLFAGSAGTGAPTER